MGKVAIVTYKVLDGKAEENRKYVEAVFNRLKENSPAGVNYSSVVADDKLTFTHIAHFESEESKKALTESIEFKEFQKDLKARCEIPPQPKFCEIVGSFRMF